VAIGQGELKRAADLALAGDWDGAHRIVQQDETDSIACWLHGCLHKIEGDTGNARYWYRRSGGRRYEDYSDAKAELTALIAALR